MLGLREIVELELAFAEASPGVPILGVSADCFVEDGDGCLAAPFIAERQGDLNAGAHKTLVDGNVVRSELVGYGEDGQVISPGAFLLNGEDYSD